MKHSLAIVMLFCWAARASAYCYEPADPGDPPSLPSSYSKPDVPYCLSSYSYSGDHECSSWELDNYFSEVEDYQRQLRNFVRELESYQSDVEDYIDSAAAYAACEFEEVSNQHE